MSQPASGNLTKLNILCESRLVPVVEIVAAELRNRGAVDVQISSGSTDNILKQLAKDKKSADGIIVEDKAAVSIGAGLGIVEEAALITLASDKLVIVVRSGSRLDPLQTLQHVKPGRVVLADPKKSVLGLHSQKALMKIGIWDAVSQRSRYVSDGRAAVKEVSEKTAAAAVVYATDVLIDTEKLEMTALPNRSYFPIIYFGLPVIGTSKHKEAKAFLEYLASPSAKDAWLKYGFSPPPAGLP